MTFEGSYRVEKWVWHLLDERGELVRELEGASDGSLAFNMDATVRCGGTVDLADADGVDWLHSLIRPVWSCTSGGESVEVPFGVYVPVVGERRRRGGRETTTFRLLDVTCRLDDACPDYVHVPAGAQVVATARAFAAQQGLHRLRVTDSQETLKAGLTWPPGTPWRTVVNELLRAAGYAAVWADRHGQVVVEPYVPPNRRAVARIFRHGSTSIISADSTAFDKMNNVPNRVVTVGRSADVDAPSPVGQAVNINPADPLSYPRLGRWVTRVFTEDATEKAVLNSLAERHLLELSDPGRAWKVEHANVPDVWLGDRVEARLEHETLHGTVNEMKLSCTPGSLISALWNAVNTRK